MDPPVALVYDALSVLAILSVFAVPVLLFKILLQLQQTHIVIVNSGTQLMQLLSESVPHSAPVAGRAPVAQGSPSAQTVPPETMSQSPPPPETVRRRAGQLPALSGAVEWMQFHRSGLSAAAFEEFAQLREVRCCGRFPVTTGTNQYFLRLVCPQCGTVAGRVHLQMRQLVE